MTSTRIPTIRRILGIGLTWGALWLTVAIGIGLVIGLVDPDSIDPGDTQIAILVIGSMGLFSGIAFAVLVSLGERRTTASDLSLTRAGLWGFLACAIVQLGYLDHGDQGLAANLQMALVLCVFGSLITAAWLLIARQWSHWRSSQLPR